MKKQVLILTLFSAGLVYADVPPETRYEVDHLIEFVSNTPCQIDRNWTNHSGTEAIVHIQQKYDYFKDNIQTTEQFIEYSAAKSTMTGRDYLLKCKGQRSIKTRDWLKQELQKYRAQRDSINNGKGSP